jgi:GTP-binding protein
MNDNFIDYVKIFFRSGKGGAGSTHLHREKFIAKGGPDGGDGGRGGHIILKGDKQLWTLLHLKFRKHVHAKDGVAGSSAQKTGADGEDIILHVPLGTVAKNTESGKILCEITEENQEFIIAKGGRGGQGNTHFKSATNQTPRFAQPGEPGIEGWFILELKILADVGLVGFPNAGKSTLLSVLSSAKPKIADYPFTTLVPNLGIVKYHDNRSFIMADIPGIIEGASEGRGLGLRFLKHIERNSMLLFMVPSDSENIRKEYEILLAELEKYNSELLDKKRVLAITKCDLINAEMQKKLVKNLPDLPYMLISSKTNIGIIKLKNLLWSELNS